MSESQQQRSFVRRVGSFFTNFLVLVLGFSGLYLLVLYNYLLIPLGLLSMVFIYSYEYLSTKQDPSVKIFYSDPKIYLSSLGIILALSVGSVYTAFLIRNTIYSPDVSIIDFIESIIG